MSHATIVLKMCYYWLRTCGCNNNNDDDDV